MARRSAGRRGRPGSRFTPRRWLPFVVLLALVVGAVWVSRRDLGPDPVRSRTAPPGTVLPVASRADALSTAWYCAGGTGSGPDGAAELSAVIANAEERGIRADITVVGTSGSRRQTTIQVPARSRTRVVGSQIVEDEWVAMVVEVFGGRATVEREVQGRLGFDLSPCSTDASTRWYVPSGSTIRGARLDLVLFNPFPDATSVDISFATDQGFRSPRALRGFSIPGRSVRLIPQDELPPRRPVVATIVTARSGRLVVDRVQRYDGTGDPVAGTGADPVRTPAPQGIAATAAIPTSQPRWLFPDAIAAADVRTQVGIYNPTRRPARIDIHVRHQDQRRYPEVEPVQITVPGRAAQVVDLAQVAGITPGVPFSVDVESLDDVPVVAELLVFGAPLPSSSDAADPAEDPAVVEGFSAMPGAPVAARQWFLAGRGVSLARQATVTVSNPGAASVRVSVTQFDGGQRTPLAGASVSIAPGERARLDLAQADDTGALVVTADGGVVVGQTVIAVRGQGLSQALASPFPETVEPLVPGG